MDSPTLEVLAEALRLRKQIDELTARLEGLFARRAIARRVSTRRKIATAAGEAVSGRRRMSAAKRRAASERMKAMWRKTKRRGQTVLGS